MSLMTSITCASAELGGPPRPERRMMLSRWKVAELSSRRNLAAHVTRQGASHKQHSHSNAVDDDEGISDRNDNNGDKLAHAVDGLRNVAIVIRSDC